MPSAPLAASTIVTAPVPTGRARVIGVWDETATLRGLRLKLEEGLEGLAVGHEAAPGRALKVITSVGAAVYFAIAGTPGGPQAGEVELLIKRGAPLPDAVLAEAGLGQTLEVSGPLGPGFAASEALGRDVLLFAAGSGIAPVRSLVHHLVGQRPQVGRVTLFYGQRVAADFAYRTEHLAWERAGIRVFLCCSDPEAGRRDGWEGPIGRVQEVADRTFFGGGGLSGAVAYVCGMREMVDGVRSTLDAAGLPAGRLLLNA